MDSESFPKHESHDLPGVISTREENRHLIVAVRWTDGEVSEMHFPAIGFAVINPRTHAELGFLSAERAQALLEQQAPHIRREDFSWESAFEKK